MKKAYVECIHSVAKDVVKALGTDAEVEKNVQT